jgi:2-polyprenyl-6-methoxyphenol hydroxylase-like FAD-dependent oxidoreductase
MINNLVTPDVHPNDIKIKSIGLWRMGAVVATNYFKGKVILVGDAAHSLPPAGGFGLNTGA